MIKALFCFRRVSVQLLCLFLMLASFPLWASDSTQWGRVEDDRGTFDVEITVGRVTRIEGSVEETIRPYYEQIGQDTPGESYSLDDLGLDGKQTTFGGRIEKRWKYLTLGFGGFYYNPSAEATAIQDYYIGIDDKIEYRGEEYEYLMIPEGQAFSADLKTAFCELSLLVTPATIAPLPDFEFLPFLYLGVVGVFGSYDIDAGPPRGTVSYENPPREYVVGGRSDGWTGAGVPAVGLGGEVRIGPPDGLRLTARACYSLFRYDGSTDYIPISIRHEKRLDLDYDSFSGRARLEFPLSEKADLFFGVSYTYLKLDGDATATDKEPEEIEELREKYDKKLYFEMVELHAFTGLSF